MAGWVMIFIGGLAAFLYLKVFLPNVGTFPCVLNSLFGFYCPGCGGTRAIRALFRGKLILSLWYHPVVLYGAVIFSGFMLTQTCERIHVPGIKGWKFHPWYLYGAAAVILLNFIGKNILLRCFGITL